LIGLISQLISDLCCCVIWLSFLPQLASRSVPRPPHLWGFLDHTQTHYSQ